MIVARSSVFVGIGALVSVAASACSGATHGSSPAAADDAEIASDDGGISDAGAGPWSCERILGDHFTTGTPSAGSWGDLPAFLQQVPPESMLCGAYIDEASTMEALTTSLSPKQIWDFYTPVVTAIPGCLMGSMDQHGPDYVVMSFGCENPYKMGTITFDLQSSFYTLVFG